ncbi:MAG: hypothetical protein WBC44_06400 [Planctomycetaceae bacterium]
MTGHLLIAVLALGAEAPTESEGEYVVRVDVAGYVDAPLTDPPPEEMPLRSIEVLCRPGEPFRSRTNVGKETTTVSGVLKRAEGEAGDASEFVVELRYSHVVDTGQTVPVAPGREQNILDITSSCGTMTADLDVPCVLGGITTRVRDQDSEHPDRASKTTVTVTVSEDRPSDE